MVRKHTNNNKKTNKKKTNKPKKDPNVIDNGPTKSNNDELIVEGQPLLDKKDFADFMKKSLQDNPQDFIKSLLQDLTNDKASKLIGTNPEEYKNLLAEISGPNNQKLDETINIFTQCMMNFIQVNDDNNNNNNNTNNDNSNNTIETIES